MPIKELVQARGPLACSLIEEFCKTKIRASAVTTRVTGRKKVQVPEPWKQLLQAQADSQPMPWDLVWGPAQTWFPALRRLVIEKCCGVGVVLEGPFAPALVYVFVFAKTEGGWIYSGYLPQEVSGVAKAGNLTLPADFLAFYQQVHNGFVDFTRARLLPFMATTMDNVVSEEDAFGPVKKKPYVLADLIPIYDTGSGDYICYDKKRSTTAKVIGGTYDHESPRDNVFGKDVKSLVNERFEYSMKDFVSPEH